MSAKLINPGEKEEVDRALEFNGDQRYYTNFHLNFSDFGTYL